ncbi:MAG: hypothetical protein SOY47_15130 [Lachnospiraceae bacterium]|nr:hypothetical protein [Lachnospiraceae bacterium]
MIIKLNEEHLNMICEYMEKSQNGNVFASDSIKMFDFSDYGYLRNIIFNELLCFFAIIDKNSITNLLIVETMIDKKNHNSIQILYLDLNDIKFVKEAIEEKLAQYCKKINKDKIKIIFQKGMVESGYFNNKFTKEMEFENAYGEKTVMSFFVSEVECEED